MAAPKKGRRNSGIEGRPGRALALILVAMAALVGGMFISGHTTPRLGIDLAGGTSITLTAKADQANAINKTNMDTATSIINRRVNGLGVSEAEVQTQGENHIVVNIPTGTNSEQAEKQVGTTAQLYFRSVLAQVASAPAATDSASPSASVKPSGSASASTDSEKATGSSSSPSASATTQGRAVSDALKADAPSTPSASASASAAADASASPSASATAGATEDTSIPAALQAKFETLDCTDPEQRSAAGQGAKTTDKILACGLSQDVWYKYVLGPVDVDGKNVTDANAGLDTQQGKGWLVTLKFDSTGSKDFAAATGRIAAQTPNQFAIVLDGDVVSAPSVTTSIAGGSAEISGSFTQQSATDLANVLSYGSLPLSFEISDRTTVSPALGGDQLKGGLIAGAVGLVLVVLYMLAYYRGLGVVAIVSLLVSAALTYAIMCLLGPGIGFALNLPAVCGAIVAIGITADSFIVFFERIRDEIREGRSLSPAVARGWPRARRTILVSDFVSFLAAAVLFVVTVGKVQGFAFTLGLTTLLDVVVVYLFTKPLMTILARRKFFAGGHKWSGLDPRGLGAQPPIRRTRRSPASTEAKEA